MSGNIGENIVKCRKLNGMSQCYLAKRIGLSSQGLFKIEKGLVSPRVATLEKIMIVLSITPNQIFGIERIDEEDNDLFIDKPIIKTKEKRE
jgi:Predicted transcriptional regulators